MAYTPKRPFWSVMPESPDARIFDKLSDLLDAKLDPIIKRLDNIEKFTIQEVRSEVTSIRTVVQELKVENKYLKDKVLALESQSRRDNLRFDGIVENLKKIGQTVREPSET